MDIEAAIIGGGAVGLAVAAELSGTRQVAVIERHAGFGMETEWLRVEKLPTAV